MQKKWMLCVVALVQQKPRKYENFYLGVQGEVEDAHKLQDKISRKGFVSDGQRFFPDQIETITVKEHSGDTNE